MRRKTGVWAAWIAAMALSLPAAAQTMVTTSDVNVRTAPETGQIVRTLGSGTEVDIVSADAGWAKTSDGYWISSEYLQDMSVAAKQKKAFETECKRPLADGSPYEDKAQIYKIYARNSDKFVATDNLLSYTSDFSIDGSSFWLTIVIMKDALQVKEGLSYDDMGGTRELVTNFAKRTGAAIAINGSYFSYATGEPAWGNVFIHDGNIVKWGVTSGLEVCLKNDGTLFSPQAGLSAQDLINEGVTASWGTSDPPLIVDGYATDLSPASTNPYPRTAIGMIEPDEYVIITAGSSNYAGGLTFRGMQQIFLDLGCTYARSLDGGGSSSLVFDGELMNTPAAGAESPVVDFL